MAHDLAYVKKIFQQDKYEIIKEYKGVGAGIGMRENIYTIIVYIDDSKIKLLDNLSWKTIPVKMEFTGKIILH